MIGNNKIEHRQLDDTTEKILLDLDSKMDTHIDERNSLTERMANLQVDFNAAKVTLYVMIIVIWLDPAIYSLQAYFKGSTKIYFVNLHQH